MSLQILAIYGHGDAKTERVILEAVADINLRDYAIVDTTFNKSGKISDVMRHYFRFPVLSVKKGERVSLRSRKGADCKSKTSETVLHLVHWNSDAPIWNDSNPDVAELLRVTTVEKRKSS